MIGKKKAQDTKRGHTQMGTRTCYTDENLPKKMLGRRRGRTAKCIPKKGHKTPKYGMRGQEEMVGFAVIIIIVSVILLIFLAIMLRNPQKESVESYEVESFLQAMLQYTTDCENTQEFLSVQKLMFDCYSNEVCLDGRMTCEVLNKTMVEIIEKAWKRAGSPIKGYLFDLNVEEADFLTVQGGQLVGISRGGTQYFSRGGNDFDLSLEVYGV